METLERDYSPQGVRFYYIYKALAHPEHNNYVSPFTLEERLLHIREAERTLGSRIPWLSDTMDDNLIKELGGVPNAELVIDPELKVAARRAWSNPKHLRRDLERLVGPVESPTEVADLDMETQPPPPGVARGIVPRVETPRPMTPLKIEPHVESAEAPFYVKLRAEVDRAFLDDGRGKLYLGFHLDPLYAVHWNNEVDPLSFELDLPPGVVVTPATATAPEVAEAADADPREFLVDLSASERDQPIGLTTRYFACDDANTFCIPVSQSYDLYLERNPRGGAAFRRWRMGPRPSGDEDRTEPKNESP